MEILVYLLRCSKKFYFFRSVVQKKIKSRGSYNKKYVKDDNIINTLISSCKL